ncbi:MAG: dihydrolipoyllysine-residue succinyltransferase [Gammaproteobacteria bacterium]|nr:dihydrolipoyllysine-residue succinyltransferase [Gammaproteobacteria bacterium]OUU11521.1 MAG: dihydrolipoamide succinyltransferase [Gammaproteobacteria bacterium TMED34]
MADSESVDIKAPEFPESVADGEVATWHVQIGEAVRRDQVIVDIETDKVVLEVVAPADGKLIAIIKEEGETVLTDELLATFEAGDGARASTVPAAVLSDMEETSEETEDVVASPAARKIAQEQGLALDQVTGTGKDGRITKEDVVKAVADAQKPSSRAINAPTASIEQALVVPGERVERRVPMTRIRASIARRLVDAQQTAAMLTTFNEVDMKPIMDLRSRYKDEFEKAHNGTRLGFMSFFVRSSIEALKRFPVVNASIDGNDIVYHGYQDVGVAVSSPRGLVVPILRDADSLTLAEIEVQIREFGACAQENKLSIDDMTGGTFTISNGGVFGSLLSTPILNPPQTAILGMHKIADRPMAVDGEVEIRPMMYLALSYDHRLIDGQEAVRFLVTIKDFLEEPARILLDL